MSPGFWGKVLEGWLEADLEADSAKKWYELLAARDVSLCPTLTVVPGAGDEPAPDQLRHVPQVEERWREATQQRAEQPASPETQERARRVRQKLQALVLNVHKAGGRIVTGTDTGAVRSLVPGFALHWEIGFLEEAGLSPMEVLRSATGQAAIAIGRDDLGTIEPGKRADLLLLGSDPLRSAAALADIRYVVSGGRVREPAELLSY
jgi:imidazolonepropionase-like amidohydrolase